MARAWDKVQCPSEAQDRIQGLMDDLGLNHRNGQRWASLLYGIQRLVTLPGPQHGGCTCERCMEHFWVDSEDQEEVDDTGLDTGD